MSGRSNKTLTHQPAATSQDDYVTYDSDDDERTTSTPTNKSPHSNGYNNAADDDRLVAARHAAHYHANRRRSLPASQLSRDLERLQQQPIINKSSENSSSMRSLAAHDAQQQTRGDDEASRDDTVSGHVIVKRYPGLRRASLSMSIEYRSNSSLEMV